MLWLNSLIISRAVYGDVFKTPFKSLDEILNLPYLEYTEVLDFPERKRKRMNSF